MRSRLLQIFRRRPRDVASMGQWDLIALRFRKHKPAVLSMIFLLGMYVMAAFAGFFSPNPPFTKDLRYLYARPMVPRIDTERGLGVTGIRQQVHPVSQEVTYLQDPDRFIPLGFFVKGEPYRLFGVFPAEHRFFGVDLERLDPSVSGEDPPRFYLFGGDRFGRCILSRILYGGQISLSIGLVSILLSFVLGVGIGGISGYMGGTVDALIQRGIEIINAFPKLPLWLVLGAALPRTWTNLQTYLGITVILSLMGWTGMARVVRGKMLSLREEDYATAADLLGAGHARIVFLHLVPGFTSHIIVSLTMTLPVMILGETSLSFLGLGLQPPTISWGVMLQDCMSMQVVKLYPWLLLPVGAIILAVMCFNFLGDGLRDAADPYGNR